MPTPFKSELPPDLVFLKEAGFEPAARFAEALQDLCAAGYKVGDPVPATTVWKHAERLGPPIDSSDRGAGLLALSLRGHLIESGSGGVRPVGPLLMALKENLLQFQSQVATPAVPNRPRRILAISAGGATGAQWNAWSRDGLATVYGPEWDKVPDLHSFPDFTAYTKFYTPSFGRKGPKDDLWKLRDLRPGDLILAIRGQSHILALGFVESPGYTFRGDQDTNRHAVHVRWEPGTSRAIPRQTAWMKTIHEVQQVDCEAWFPKTQDPGDLEQKPHDSTSPRLDEDVPEPMDLQDARQKVLAAIHRRQGQTAFRNALMARFGGRCAITGCDTPEALEAAHIVPYLGAHTNQPENGLLLRADIHTLFDLGLLDIDEATWTVRLGPRLLAGGYRSLHGKALHFGQGAPPPKSLFNQRREFLRQITT